jgi:hypothetical protein
MGFLVGVRFVDFVDFVFREVFLWICFIMPPFRYRLPFCVGIC